MNLGALRIGQSFQRAVQIINNSLAPIEFVLAITPSSPHLQQSNILTISPLSQISLKPKQVTDIFVSFMPKSRIPQFTEEVANLLIQSFAIASPFMKIFTTLRESS